MRVLLTGASGKVGRAVYAGLREAGHEVRATDLRGHPEKPGPVTFENLLDPVACCRLVDGVEAVIHFGNHSNHWKGTPLFVCGENNAMNLNLLQAAADAGVRKFIFSSSIQAVSGDVYVGEGRASQLRYLPMDGRMPVRPENPYALSKVLAEEMLRYFSATTKLSTVALRLPWLTDDISFFVERDLGGGLPTRYNRYYKLDECFAFLLQPELVRLLDLLLKAEWTGHRCYLPAMREHFIWRWSVTRMIETYYPNVPLHRPLGEIDSMVDLSELEKDLGWRPNPANFPA